MVAVFSSSNACSNALEPVWKRQTKASVLHGSWRLYPSGPGEGDTAGSRATLSHTVRLFRKACSDPDILNKLVKNPGILFVCYLACRRQWWADPACKSKQEQSMHAETPRALLWWFRVLSLSIIRIWAPSALSFCKMKPQMKSHHGVNWSMIQHERSFSQRQTWTQGFSCSFFADDSTTNFADETHSQWNTPKALQSEAESLCDVYTQEDLRPVWNLFILVRTWPLSISSPGFLQGTFFAQLLSNKKPLLRWYQSADQRGHSLSGTH